MAATHDASEAQRDDSATGSRPPLVKPHGVGFMPFFCAAQWIALESGARAFDTVTPDQWSGAYDELLAQIASGHVAISGERNGLREPIEGARFAGCKVLSLFAPGDPDLEKSERFYILSYPYLDDQHWQNAFHDSLTNRWETLWKRLMVRKEDVARLWPLDPTIMGRTGAPGRPTSQHLVLAELKRRALAGTLEASLANEARHLSTWLAAAHPGAPAMRQKSVENALRPDYKSLKKP